MAGSWRLAAEVAEANPEHGAELRHRPARLSDQPIVRSHRTDQDPDAGLRRPRTECGRLLRPLGEGFLDEQMQSALNSHLEPRRMDRRQDGHGFQVLSREELTRILQDKITPDGPCGPRSRLPIEITYCYHIESIPQRSEARCMNALPGRPAPKQSQAYRGPEG
jgi:hypothetical protein